jgi:hypothetical protein
VFAVYTQKRDVTRRMQNLLLKEGIRAEVLTADVPPEQREAWYEKKLAQGMQVCICHPKGPRKNKRSPIVATATLPTAANSASFPSQQ